MDSRLATSSSQLKGTSNNFRLATVAAWIFLVMFDEMEPNTIVRLAYGLVREIPRTSWLEREEAETKARCTARGIQAPRDDPIRMSDTHPLVSDFGGSSRELPTDRR